MRKLPMTRASALKRIVVIAALLLPTYGLIHDAGANVFRAPTTIDATGTRDVTAQLVAFIKSVPDGSTITFPAGSRYRIENIVIVENRNNLVIDGAGAFFFATTDGSGVWPTGPNGVRQLWPRHRDQWLIYNSTNITVRNLTVRGANPNGGISSAPYNSSLEAQAGVEFYGTTNAVLENCTITDTYGELVAIGHQAKSTIVRGCTLARSGSQGITMAYGRDVAIDHNNISEIRRSAIDLEPYTTTWSVENVWIVNNTFGPTQLDTVAAKGAGDVNMVVVAYNRMVNEPMSVRNTPVFPEHRRHHWYVVGNTSDTTYSSPHGSSWITYTDHVGVWGNHQPVRIGTLGVQTTGSNYLNVTDNTFPER
jgi:hypothetical protein